MKTTLCLNIALLLFSLSACSNTHTNTLSNTNYIASTYSHTNPEPLKASIIKHGLFKLLNTGKIRSEKSTSTGKVIGGATIEPVKQTKRIPLGIGNTLSFQYRIQNPPKGLLRLALKRVVTHPSIPLPNGTASTDSQRLIYKPIKQGEIFALDGYVLNETYELVEGDWSFQLWYKNTKIIEQNFTTYSLPK